MVTHVALHRFLSHQMLSSMPMSLPLYQLQLSRKQQTMANMWLICQICLIFSRKSFNTRKITVQGISLGCNSLSLSLSLVSLRLLHRGQEVNVTTENIWSFSEYGISWMSRLFPTSSKLPGEVQYSCNTLHTALII